MMQQAHLAHGQDEGEDEGGEHEVVEAGGAVRGAEPLHKLDTKIPTKGTCTKVFPTPTTTEVVNNTSAARKESAAACIESAASGGTGACVGLVGGQVAHRGEGGRAGAAADAGGRAEQVSGAAAVDEDQRDGHPNGHDVGHKVVEGEVAGRGLEVADDHGGDDEGHHVADHPGRA